MSEAALPLSVIVPTLNEASLLPTTIADIRARLPDAEIIIADGGSNDDTAGLAIAAQVILVHAPRGRGPQCRAGADAASGELLLFLHADTTLPAHASQVLQRAFAHREVKIGTFRLTFDSAHWFLRASAWCSRIDSVFTRFGDQGIVIRRDFYTELGGFSPWPLFEDVDLLRRARRQTRVWSFPANVITSARRFRRHGPVSQQLQNTRLLLRYLLGASPDTLAAEYRSEPIAVTPTFPSSA